MQEPLPQIQIIPSGEQHLEIHMSMKYMAAALLASSLVSVPAFAQSAQKSDPGAATAQTATQTLGTWRTSKMISLNVYNNNNEKIGDINELITDSSGKIDAVVIGVGGFLGMGERNVGLPWSQLKFVMEPRPANAASSSTTQTTTVGTGAETPATITTTTVASNRDYPDHVVINMTKEQLVALPAFKYVSDTTSTTTRTSPAPTR
jgi:sporulation protein YlmC with PRC-barrel domain